CGDQLRAFEIGKRREYRVRRAADEIDRAVAQRLVGLVDWVDQFERDIEPFGLEKAEFDRGFGDEIGRRDFVRNSEFHFVCILPHGRPLWAPSRGRARGSPLRFLSIEQPAELFLRLARDFGTWRVARWKLFAPM